MVEKMVFSTVLEKKKEIRFLLEKISQHKSLLFLAGSLANCLSTNVYREDGMPNDIDFITEANEDVIRSFFEKEIPEAILKASINCNINGSNYRTLQYVIYPYVENGKLDYKVYIEIHLLLLETQEINCEGLNIKITALSDEIKIKRALGREKDLMDLENFNLN